MKLREGPLTALLTVCVRWGLRITPLLSYVFIIFVVLFLYDPPRGESEGKHVSNQFSFWSDLKYIAGAGAGAGILMSCRHVTAGVKSFVLNAAGFTCVTFLTGSVAYYATTYFTHGINRWQAHIT